MDIQQYKIPTFTHGADGAPGQVRPAGDGAAAFDLLTFGTRDADRLSHMKLGSVPAAVLPPAWRSRARLSCEEQIRGIIQFLSGSIISQMFTTDTTKCNSQCLLKSC